MKPIIYLFGIFLIIGSQSFAQTAGSAASYVGCFSDSDTRALPTFLAYSNATVESCIALAQTMGFKYAGVQYYGQCFGGNTLGYAQVADSNCNLPCSANSSEICGGPWLNSVYLTSVPPSTSSGSSGTPDYWPLAVGKMWTYQDVVTGLQTIVKVRDQVPVFGPSAQYMVDSPYDVTFEKTSPTSYWDIGSTWNLHWYLGHSADGTLISTGEWMWDYVTGMPVNNTCNEYSEDPNNPPYVLIGPNSASGQSVSYSQSYPARIGVEFGPLGDTAAGNTSYSIENWSVSWTATSVSVPAYTGPAMMATYNEGGQQIEDWYYADGIGVVKIVSRAQGGSSTGTEIDLVSMGTFNPITTTCPLTLNSVAQTTYNFQTGQNATWDITPTGFVSGDSLTYTWFGTFNGNFDLTGVVNPPSAYNGTFATPGTYTRYAVLIDKQTGDYCRTSTITINVNPASSSPPIAVPLPTFNYFTVNGQNTSLLSPLVLSVGGTGPNGGVYYSWSTANATTVSSTLSYMSPADKCGNVIGEAWGVTSTSGITPLPTAIAGISLPNYIPVIACQAGVTYGMTLTAYNSAGQSVSSTVYIRVQ